MPMLKLDPGYTEFRPSISPVCASRIEDSFDLDYAYGLDSLVDSTLARKC